MTALLVMSCFTMAFFFENCSSQPIKLRRRPVAKVIKTNSIPKKIQPVGETKNELSSMLGNADAEISASESKLYGDKKTNKNSQSHARAVANALANDIKKPKVISEKDQSLAKPQDP